MKKNLLLTAIALVLLLVSCGQPTATVPPTISELDERIQRVENGLIRVSEDGQIMWEEKMTLAERMEYYEVPGVSIAVINNFEVEWAKGYGVLEAGRDEPVTHDTLFHAASIAKPVSAAAALALVERGLLDLDENVNDRLLSWQVPENEYTTEEKVALRRLLSHSAGLTDGWGKVESCYALGGEAPTVTIQQIMDAEAPAGPIKPTRVTMVPGTQYRYSNLGYGIVELLIVDVAQKPFPEFMQETVLGPLGMISSTFEQPLPEDLRATPTTEHYESGQPFEGKRHHFPILASGGLWTTPSDLARFAVEIMLSRAGKPNKVLSQEMANQMLTPQIDNDDEHGLAFELSGEGQDFRFIHTGATWGSSSVLMAFAKRGQGAVVMTNAASGPGIIRLEILLSISAEYGWPITPPSR